MLQVVGHARSQLVLKLEGWTSCQMRLEKILQYFEPADFADRPVLCERKPNYSQRQQISQLRWLQLVANQCQSWRNLSWD